MRRRASAVAGLALGLHHAAARAAGRDPLAAPLREWLAVIGLSLLGGAASWVGRVRARKVRDASLLSLAGESVIAGFAGLLAFMGCQAADFGQAATLFLAGVAGHAGPEGIKLIESAVKRRAATTWGDSGPAMGAVEPESAAPFTTTHTASAAEQAESAPLSSIKERP